VVDVRSAVPIGNPVHGRNRLSQADANDEFGPQFLAGVRHKKSATVIGEQKEVWSDLTARIGNRPWIGIASGTAVFRLRAAHSGDEDLLVAKTWILS
jgi:hypothetical protein